MIPGGVVPEGANVDNLILKRMCNVPRTNYQFEKRQRDLAKKKKKEEKRQRKLEKNRAVETGNHDVTVEETEAGGEDGTEPGNRS